MNKEIVTYHSILSEDIPSFLKKYLNTYELKRLKNISFFCGADYTRLMNTKYYYSRYNHSLSVALIVWHFTHDKEETIAALLHDIGTPSFSHVVDYLLNDYMLQEHSEKNIVDVINKSKKLKKLLDSDNISLKKLNDLSNYPILENTSPKLCADRLDAVLTGLLILTQKCNVNFIKTVYNSITILQNEEGKKELGFNDISIAEKYFDKQYFYSMSIMKNENKYVLQYIADILKTLINKKELEFEDLYMLSEKDIIKKIKKVFKSWKLFNEADKITRTSNIPLNNYFISVVCKKRYTNPLVKENTSYKRVIDASEKSKILFVKYNNFNDSKYAYIKEIKNL